ncbi:unnamed protein product [Spodoptera littoralis]|uniref:Uncharacterized protein n=1 Tax=Spodoptera littoralis TaxID=7109 RepID=A0A9P0IHZ9_SPOLI|nr:unnamed protein product [Spodoptera littoralis]CAH1646156.1 unnamed protein product [Spodoptera littoralis]
MDPSLPKFLFCTRGLKQLPTHIRDGLFAQYFFVDANQISRLSRSHPDSISLSFEATETIVFSFYRVLSRAPLVICEPLKRPGVDNGLFIGVPPLLSCTYASFAGHKVPSDAACLPSRGILLLS